LFENLAVWQQPGDCVEEFPRTYVQPPCRSELKATLGLTVLPDGSVKSATLIVMSPERLPGMQCLERAVRRWRFPEHAGQEYQVTDYVHLGESTPCYDPPAPKTLGGHLVPVLMALLLLGGAAAASVIALRRPLTAALSAIGLGAMVLVMAAQQSMTEAQEWSFIVAGVAAACALAAGARSMWLRRNSVSARSRTVYLLLLFIVFTLSLCGALWLVPVPAGKYGVTLAGVAWGVTLVAGIFGARLPARFLSRGAFLGAGIIIAAMCRWFIA